VFPTKHIFFQVFKKIYVYLTLKQKISFPNPPVAAKFNASQIRIRDDRLENIRYRQICLHDNTDMSVSKHYVVSKSSGGGKNECKPDIESTKNIRYRQICMHDNIDMSVSKNYVVSKSSGGGKIECKPGMHFENSRVLIVFKTSGTSKFACMITLIYIFISKKNVRRLQNLRYWQICIQDGV